ncbi:MAG TPA: AAA family ATPase [bacterium]|nr:AAA family ATPase [bacterium]
MSRKNKQSKQKPNKQAKQPQPGAAAKTPTATTTSTISKQIEELSSAASANMTEADLKAIETISAPDQNLKIDDLIRKGNEALALLDVQRLRLQQEEEKAKEASKECEKKKAELDTARDDLKAQTTELQKERSTFENTKKTHKRLEDELLAREEAIVQRENDADAGFARRNRKSLEELEKEAEQLRSEFSAHRTRIAEERAGWEKELQGHRADLENELAGKRVKFDQELEKEKKAALDAIQEEREKLEKQQSQIKKDESRLRQEDSSIKVDRELLDEEKATFKERVERHAAAQIEEKNAEIVALKERLEAAQNRNRYLDQELASFDEATVQFEGRSPSDVLKELRKLKLECDKLRTERDSRPGAEAMQRLADLERQRETWQSERIQLLGECAELRQDVALRRIAVTDLEALRNHKAALEASNELLTTALQDEIRKVNELVRGESNESPFESCSQMDGDSSLQSSQPTVDTIKSLKAFTEYVRDRMSDPDPETQKRLFYSLPDVRSFIAGLSMSRLHLLQGISGTGKTSLPRAFARAIGAGHEKIAVQAGWRDKQDLIGHYNTFERRYSEQPLLKALYRAGCPFHHDIPFIIVLDEVNLSHLEQYFADFLSALEEPDPRKRLIALNSKNIANAPIQMQKYKGEEILIPLNVWFIGTANHDETTKDFADKTYDRAHVMELPRHRDEFPTNNYQPSHPVSLAALQEAFTKAIVKHSDAARHSYKFLDEHLGETLADLFGVGWGNRLERQIENYVPVVIECGGNDPGLLGEATDHILTTKLLRKIRDRHDTRPEDILALRDQIQGNWHVLDARSEPLKSIALLKKELHRLGHKED